MTRRRKAPDIRIAEARFYERQIRLRMPFRFGVVTLREAPEAFVRVRVAADGREAWGMAAEMLAPKWFDKDPDLSNEENFRQLRRSLGHAAKLYLSAGGATAFDLFAGTYRDQIAACGAEALNPLIAGYGPALLDRAVLDGLCRIEGVPVFEALRRNLPGIRQTALTPDLDGFDLDAFLAGLAPATTIQARHTVGLVDPIAESDRAIGDGLPETLTEVIARYGQRYFKLKIGGDLQADLARLVEIADVLDRLDGPYWCTLDGNEQYQDLDGIMVLWQAILAAPRLKRLSDSVLFIEQPIERGRALVADVAQLSAWKPVIIDESDATLDAFPRARARGYRGVSSKSCKGLYKALLNRARCAYWNATAGEQRYFMSAEDLTTQAGLALQQDLALAGLIGAAHVERNGHHYVNGMAAAPEAEQQAFLAAHPDLYQRTGGVVRLSIAEGRIALGSLNGPGFASGAEPEWMSLSEMQLPERG